MSLKLGTERGCMLRVNDHHHAEYRELDVGADRGVRQGQPLDWLLSSGRASLRVDRASAENPAVPAAEQGTERDGAPFPGESNRTKPGAGDAAHCWMGQVPACSSQTKRAAMLSKTI